MGLAELTFIDYRTEMGAPVEDVFAFFKKVEEWPSWGTGIKQASRKGDADWGRGFRLGFTPDFLPIPLMTKVIDYEEGRLIEWGLRTPVAAVVHRFEFEPLGESNSSVRQLEYAQGLLAVLLRPLKGKIEAFDRQLSDDLVAAIGKGLHRD